MIAHVLTLMISAMASADRHVRLQPEKLTDVMLIVFLTALQRTAKKTYTGQSVKHYIITNYSLTKANAQVMMAQKSVQPGFGYMFSQLLQKSMLHTIHKSQFLNNNIISVCMLCVCDVCVRARVHAKDK